MVIFSSMDIMLKKKLNYNGIYYNQKSKFENFEISWMQNRKIPYKLYFCESVCGTH